MPRVKGWDAIISRVKTASESDGIYQAIRKARDALDDLSLKLHAAELEARSDNSLHRSSTPQATATATATAGATSSNKTDAPVHAKSTREKLITSAMRLVSAQGYERTTVDEIAACAGLTKGAFYSQFSSKEDFMSALLEAKTCMTIDEKKAAWASFIHAPRQAFEARWLKDEEFLLFLELIMYALRHQNFRHVFSESLEQEYRAGSECFAALAGRETPSAADKNAVFTINALGFLGTALSLLLDSKEIITTTLNSIEAILEQYRYSDRDDSAQDFSC